jgi:hypothetical protein
MTDKLLIFKTKFMKHLPYGNLKDNYYEEIFVFSLII